MLIWNLQSVCKARGIERPYSFLIKSGLPEWAATSILNNTRNTIQFKYLEIICAALNCTPDDLFQWKPDPHKTLPEGHQLYKLTDTLAPSTDLLNEINKYSIKNVREIVQKLNSGDKDTQ
jgi:hypothetical protein